MPIAFLCPYCKKRLEFPRSQAGQRIPCGCGVTVTVPTPPPAKAQAPTEGAGKAAGELIVFNCPQCKKRFKARPDAAGKKIKCPCGARLAVPGAGAEGRAKPAATRIIATVSFNCNLCRKRHTVSVDLAGQKGRCDCGLAYVVPTPSVVKARAQADAEAKAAAEAEAKAAAEAKANQPKPATEDTGENKVVFNCPRCKRRIALPASQAGRKASCTCGARFVIPARSGRRPVEIDKSAPAGKSPGGT